MRGNTKQTNQQSRQLNKLNILISKSRACIVAKLTKQLLKSMLSSQRHYLSSGYLSSKMVLKKVCLSLSRFLSLCKPKLSTKTSRLKSLKFAQNFIFKAKYMHGAPSRHIFQISQPNLSLKLSLFSTAVVFAF